MQTSNELIAEAKGKLLLAFQDNSRLPIDFISRAIDCIIEAAVMEAVEKILGSITEVRMKEWHPEIKLL